LSELIRGLAKVDTKGVDGMCLSFSFSLSLLLSHCSNSNHKQTNINKQTQKKKTETKKTLKQIHRFLGIEKLLPSYRNQITIACLKALSHLHQNSKAQLDAEFFSDYMR